MAKLRLLICICVLIPLAACFRPERIFDDMSGNGVRDALFGIAGLCASAGQCFDDQLSAVDEGAVRRYNAFHKDNPWPNSPGNGTEGSAYNGTDDAEYGRAYMQFEVENIGHGVEDVCAMLIKTNDECASKCEVDENSVYGTLGQPMLDFVCRERLDEVKSVMMCIRRLAMPRDGGDIDLFGECPRPRQLAQEWLQGVMTAARGGQQLSALADKVLGAGGAAATLCKNNACYTEHFQSVVEEHCGGEKTTVLADFQSMVTPHMLKIIDSMHIGCLVPDGCKGTLPFAAALALAVDMS